MAWENPWQNEVKNMAFESARYQEFRGKYEGAVGKGGKKTISTYMARTLLRAKDPAFYRYHKIQKLGMLPDDERWHGQLKRYLDENKAALISPSSENLQGIRKVAEKAASTEGYESMTEYECREKIAQICRRTGANLDVDFIGKHNLGTLRMSTHALPLLEEFLLLSVAPNKDIYERKVTFPSLEVRMLPKGERSAHFTLTLRVVGARDEMDRIGVGLASRCALFLGGRVYDGAGSQEKIHIEIPMWKV